MRTKTHWAFAAIAASALALAGCGGGGSSSTTTVAPPAGPPAPPPATEPPPAPTPEAVTLPSADNKYLEPADTTLEDTTAPVMLATGGTHDVGAYTLTCTVGPCEIEIADGEVTATGTVTADYTTAAMATIDAAKTVAAAERMDRATGLFSALTDADGDYAEEIRANEKNGDFKISRGLSGMAMVSDGGKSGWSTRAAPNALAGYQGTVLDNGKTQTYTVYTDIAAAKRKAYDGAYSNDGTTTTLHPVIRFEDDGTTGSGITVTEAPTAPVTTPVKGQLGLTAAQMTLAANRGLLDPAKFPQPKEPGKGENKYEYTGAVGKKAASFDGTFHGASGTYSCATSDCVVTVTAPSTNSGPVYTVTGGAWTFSPKRNNAPMIVEQDNDHMHFGWWVNTPKARAVGDEFLYDAQVFFGGSMPFNTQADIVALQGDAGYTGPAAGLFVVTGDNAAHGEFTATATLTAKFGTTVAGTTVGREGGTVSGTISKFMRDDGVANDWALALGPAGIAAGGTPADDGKGSGNIVDGIDQIGGWNFQLYGPGTNGANPTGIAGAFDAKIDKNTAVAGAFATK